MAALEKRNLARGSELDQLFGGDGDDWLDGGAGQVDRLNGGAGNDSFADYYYLLALNMQTLQFKQEDSILDFVIGSDQRRTLNH